MQIHHLLALAMAVATSEAAYKGFNYGSTKPDGSQKYQADFQEEFSTAKSLVGASGFNSARLYTMIQGGTANGPISAIPAAIAEDTSLLLGLWASGNNIHNEIIALRAAIDQYGQEFADKVVGISVGSEDLYRNSVIGVQADAGVGVDPHVLAGYINEIRDIISDTVLSGCPIGHVDTWNDWVNGSNSAVIDAVDWIGFDGYPYFQNSMDNSIDDAKALFEEAVAKTQAAAGDKEVWITETGWPVSGDVENLAVASIPNAQRFWEEVGCPLFDNVNTWWYILQDASGDSVPNPSFGIVGSTLTNQPLFDLTCSNSSRPSSTGVPTRTATAIPGATGGATGGGAGAGSGSGSGSGSNSSGSGSEGVGGPGGAAGHGSAGNGSSANLGNGTGPGSASPSGSGSNPNANAGKYGNYGTYGPYGSYGSYNSSVMHPNGTKPSRPSASPGNVGLSKGSGAAAPSSTTMFTGAANTLTASIVHVALLGLLIVIAA